MPGFPFAAIGTGLGQGAEAIQKQREAQLRDTLTRLALARQQRQQQADSMAYTSLLSPDAFAGTGGPSQPASQTFDMTAGPDGSYRTSSYEPGNNGFSSGLAKLISLGVSPDVARGAVGYMQRNESGNDPLAVNPTSGALGRAQWLGPRKESLVSTYGPQPSDPQQADFMGRELQGPEKRTLDDLRSARTDQQGYDIWGRDFERPGAAALAKAGVGSGSVAIPEVKQIAQQTIQMTPPDVYGRMSLQGLARQVERANPGADPATKMLAVEQLYKLLAPGEQQMWAIAREEHRDAVAERTRLATQDFQRQQQIDREAAQDRRAEMSLGKNALPPELQVPETWEGMPDKAPPGVRQDVWQSSLEYVRTGKMPALGFQPGMRNLIVQASPAAASALGVRTSEVPDLQAGYAGERHGQIVGGGRAANIEFGIQEAKKAAPQVIATSKDVPRTEFPAFNQFTNWLQEKTGDPNIIAFREALNTYLNVYASTVSRTGRLTDAQQRHAYDLLSTNFSQGQIDRGIQQLDYEMSLMQESVEPAMENIRRLGQPSAIRQPQQQATPPQGQPPVIKLDAQGNEVR